MVKPEIYLVLSHVESTYENEFLGVFSSVDFAKNFVQCSIDAGDSTIGYSKITVHPVPLDEPFNFISFSDNAVAVFAKVDGRLKLV